ncbi:eukaryotic translation initiation factor 5-like [Ostrea edulis]|uniref:eukaryotic translation initiation factor 5-like n=1 Tax=Ostrea edulis TaxID=37623 RepID=UPI002094B0EB|nr:eukaryotic translation initiation factor 5-like [Ostrea edulis]XP_056020688.1 eukaryotic translation initiation factor 5-like [Ostrea edulis]
MAAININSEVTDQFYRYKMPRLIAKVEGKGNGIKTVIVNMPEIAKALSRPPTYPTKYFGCELGAQTMFDFKNERFIVNGSHDASKLQLLLDGFIKRFVLCPECSNPETQLNCSQKKQTISQRCIACGNTGMIDMRHKLTTFILKNPPDQDPAATPTKQTKKDKKKNKAVNGEKKDDRASPEANAQEQMAAQRASGGVVDAPPVVETSKNEDEDDWGEDFSEEAVRNRMEELSTAAKQMAFTDDLEKTQEERLNMFYKFVELKRETFPGGGDKEVVAEAERLEIKDKAPLILVEVLLDVKVLQQLKQHRNLFLRFCHENPKSQKYMLGGIEQLVGNVHKEELLPKVPHVLKTLYDLDIIDEEVLLEWDKKVSKKYVDKKVSAEIHEKATPFINWLKEAEEDDSEEEEEEEEDQVEVVYSNFEGVGQKEVQRPVAREAPPAQDEEDDLDIDDI